MLNFRFVSLIFSANMQKRDKEVIIEVKPPFSKTNQFTGSEEVGYRPASGVEVKCFIVGLTNPTDETTVLDTLLAKGEWGLEFDPSNSTGVLINMNTLGKLEVEVDDGRSWAAHVRC